MAKVGLILPIQGREGGLAEHLEQLGEEVRAAERAGFDAVFLPEFHQSHGGAVVSPFLVMARLSSETSRIKFGSMVLAGPLHDPVRLAEDVLMLDHATRGRVIVGLGTAHMPPDFKLYGRPRNKRGLITDELMDLLDLCWSNEAFDYQGEYFQRAGHVTPPPFTDPHPPVWFGAHGPRGLARAAQRGNAWVCDPQRSIEIVAGLADQYRQEARKADRPSRVVLFREAWIGDDAAECESTWAPHAMKVHRLYFNVGVYRPEFEPWVAEIKSREDFTLDRLASGRFLYGSGEEVLATAREWLAQTGSDYIAVRMRHPTGPTHAETLAAIERFGSEVVTPLDSSD